jgi:hypothetical protein
MEFEEFEIYMNKLKDYLEKEDKLDTALKELSPDFGGFHLDEIITGYTDLLAKLVGDKGSEWISYYIWETNWGTAFNEPSVFDKNNNPIPFKTIEDVYNIIISERNE